MIFIEGIEGTFLNSKDIQLLVFLSFYLLKQKFEKYTIHKEQD